MKFHYLWPLIISLFLSGMLACTRNDHSGPDASKPQASGGIDGSGGFTGLSTIDQVLEAHEKAKLKMDGALKRIEAVLAYDKFDSLDKRWTKRRIGLLTTFSRGNAKINKPAREFLAQVKWNLKKTSGCDSSGGLHTDGAAKEPNTICISIFRLTRFSVDKIEAKLIQLYGHEIAHLYFGTDEQTAIDVDSFFAEAIDIAFPDPQKIKSTLESIDMGAIPEAKLKQFEQFENESALICYKATISLNYGFVLIFRKVFENPDPEVYFPPEFMESFAQARTFMDGLQKNNDNSRQCELDADKFWYFDQLVPTIASFKAGVALWKKFYADILAIETVHGETELDLLNDLKKRLWTPSKSIPVNIEAS